MNMLVGVFFGVLIGIAGAVTLILPARRYLKTSISAIIRDEYSLDEYLEKKPKKGVLTGELKAEEDVKAPISSRNCAFFKIKEKTRTYHSSGGSKKNHGQHILPFRSSFPQIRR